MKLSVSMVVCTHNRAHLLEGLINSLCKQDYPKELSEIVVVDNASTDHTKGEVERLKQNSIPSIAYLYEGTLGVSHARNAGAKAATGDILAFIDDDAVAEPGWLTGLMSVFQKDPQVVCVTGKIDLLWLVPRPDWTPLEFEGYLGSNRHMGNEMLELPEKKAPFEGNFAVRRKEYLAVGGFNPEFGPKGGKMRMLEGAAFAHQLRQVGLVMYTPFAVVKHLVPAERVTRRYFISRGYRQGLSNGQLKRLRNPKPLLGRLRDLLVDSYHILQVTGKILLGVGKGSPDVRFGRYVSLATWMGQFHYDLAHIV